MATSIPTIASQLHSASGYTWVGAAFLLGTAAAMPIWAKLSDIWGRKHILLIAVAMFFASSIVCALSASMAMLIAGRAIQGAAGCDIIQLVTITISDLFSMRSEAHWSARLISEQQLTFLRSRSLYLGPMEFVWAFAGLLALSLEVSSHNICHGAGIFGSIYPYQERPSYSLWYFLMCTTQEPKWLRALGPSTGWAAY